jgi:hypothetical protein
MAGRTLTVYLAADTSKFRSHMSTAGDSLDGPTGLKGKIGGLASNLTNMLGPALLGAGVAAAGLAVKFGIDGVQAAIADEAAAAKLATTLLNLGLAHDTIAVEAMIDALQRETGVADDQLRPAFARLVTSIGDTDAATGALQLAMDIAAGTGKSLDTVVAALGKAYDGNTGGLSRLGAGLDTAILKTGDMDVITSALAAKFGGQAATAASTYQGSVDRLAIGFDELKESFGAGFLGSLGTADTATGDMTDTMKDLEPAVKLVGETVGETATALSELIGYGVEAKQVFEDFKDSLGPFEVVVDAMTDALDRMANPLFLIRDAANAARDALASLGLEQASQPAPTTNRRPILG